MRFSFRPVRCWLFLIRDVLPAARWRPGAVFLVTVLAAAAVSSGSTRAQAQAHFTANLTPEQEVNTVISAARGTAAFTLTDEGLQYFITVEGLSGPITSATIERAERGLNGFVVRTITGDLFSGNAVSPNTAWGVWTSSDSPPLTPATITDLHAGLLYVSIATAANPGGEVRGQLDLRGGVHARAHLTGAQVEPPSGSAGWGAFTATISEEALEYKATITNLAGTVTEVGLYAGGIGETGILLRDLTSDVTGPTFRGYWSRGELAGALTDDILQQLLLGDVYLGVHTTTHPPGELRGQVHVATGFGASGMLEASQVVPPPASGGAGVASCTLSPLGLAIRLAATDLDGAVTSIELREGPSGGTGPLLRDFTADAQTGTNDALLVSLWRPDDPSPLDPAAMAAVLRGETYVLISTTAHPAGELRAQLSVDAGRTSMSARLSGAQAEPASGAAASGVASLRLTDGVLEIDAVARELTGPLTSMLLRAGPIGTNGDTLFDATPFASGSAVSAVWDGASSPPLTGAEISQLLIGDVYLELGTAAHPSGEVRGQVELAAGTGFEIALTGEQEVPPTVSPTTGTGAGTLTPDGLAYEIVVDDITLFTVAHLHYGPTGDVGTIYHGFGSTFDNGRFKDVWLTSGSGALTLTRKRDLLLGDLYANVHTGTNPGGEVRGQVLLRDGFALAGALVGGAEVPPVATPGMGTSSATLCQAGLVYGVSAADLLGDITVAHFHQGEAGVNGPAEFEITADFDKATARGVWYRDGTPALTGALAGALLEDEIYLNVHSTMFPAGEIRSQQSVPATSAVPVPTGHGGSAASLDVLVSPQPFARSTTVAFTLDEPSSVRLETFDAVGRRVHSPIVLEMEAGRRELVLAPGLASSPGGPATGVLFYRLRVEGRGTSREAWGKLVRIR